MQLIGLYCDVMLCIPLRPREREGGRERVSERERDESKQLSVLFAALARTRCPSKTIGEKEREKSMGIDKRFCTFTALACEPAM